MASQHFPDVPAFLTAGPLVLATGTRELTGPAGTVRVMRSAYRLLDVLMRQPGQVVPVPRLLAAVFDANEPEDPERALVMRINRARSAMELVGVSGDRLHCSRQDGYWIEGAPAVVRTFSPAQAAVLDRLVATHPDRELVAELAA